MSEHNHDCNCNHDDCNCGCHNDEAVTVTLTLDNDEVVECAVLTIYEADEREYIALLPLNEDGENEDGDVFIYRYKEVDGEPTLENIEDDDEYEVAADALPHRTFDVPPPSPLEVLPFYTVSHLRWLQ